MEISAHAVDAFEDKVFDLILPGSGYHFFEFGSFAAFPGGFGNGEGLDDLQVASLSIAFG